MSQLGVDSSKFFVQFRSFLQGLQSDCKELRQAVDTPIQSLGGYDTLCHASTLVEQINHQVTCIEEEMQCLQKLPGLHPIASPSSAYSSSFQYLLSTCEAMFKVNAEWSENLEHHLEQYGYIKKPPQFQPAILDVPEKQGSPAMLKPSFTSNTSHHKTMSPLVKFAPKKIETPKTPTLDDFCFSAATLALCNGPKVPKNKMNVTSLHNADDKNDDAVTFGDERYDFTTELSPQSLTKAFFPNSSPPQTPIITPKDTTSSFVSSTLDTSLTNDPSVSLTFMPKAMQATKPGNTGPSQRTAFMTPSSMHSNATFKLFNKNSVTVTRTLFTPSETTRVNTMDASNFLENDTRNVLSPVSLNVPASSVRLTPPKASKEAQVGRRGTKQIAMVGPSEIATIPTYLRAQFSLEALNGIIASINKHVAEKENIPSENDDHLNVITETDLRDRLQLGGKARATLLTLVQLKRVHSECRSGITVFALN